MLFEGKVTTDPYKIKEWAEERCGYPALKIEPGSRSQRRLVIVFSTHEDNSAVSKIAWEEFFEMFAQDQLAFLYQETGLSGELSRSYSFL